MTVRIVSNIEEIYKHLTYFCPLVDEKIDQNYLKPYSKKVQENGHLYIAEDEQGKALAMSVCYYNDEINKTAYVSWLVANPEAKGVTGGIAVGKMLKVMLKDAKNAGMEYVRLEVKKDNVHAIQLYEKGGCHYEKDASADSIYMRGKLENAALNEIKLA